MILKVAATAAAKSLQSCPTLCDPIDGSPLGSSVPGILQARTLEWVAIYFSNAWKWKVKVKSLSRVRLLATPWTAAYQALPSMGISRQEYWSGVPLPSPSKGYVNVLNNRSAFHDVTGYVLRSDKIVWSCFRKESIFRDTWNVYGICFNQTNLGGGGRWVKAEMKLHWLGVGNH